MLRSTRASRGEYTTYYNQSVAIAASLQDEPSKALKEIPVRKWQTSIVKFGHIRIRKWVPVEQEQPTAELQAVAKAGSKREAPLLTTAKWLKKRASLQSMRVGGMGEEP